MFAALQERLTSVGVSSKMLNVKWIDVLNLTRVMWAC